MAERAYDMDPGQALGGGLYGMEDPDTPIQGMATIPGIGAEEWRRAGYERNITVGGPRYTSEHRWLLANLPEEELIRLQETMEEVGFSRMKIGTLDDATIENWVELLGLANRHGEDWTETLGRLQSARGGLEGAKEELPEFTPETFVQQDPVAMAEAVRQTIRDRLKREPTEYEIDQLVQELGGLNRLQHEQEQELAELRFNAEQLDEGEVPEEHSIIDPAARFRQKFEEKYAGELDHLEEVDELAGQRDALHSNVAAMDRAVRR